MENVQAHIVSSHFPFLSPNLRPGKHKISFFWNSCSDIVANHWADSPLSMLPIYQELIAAGLRIWVFRQVLSAAEKRALGRSCVLS